MSSTMVLHKSSGEKLSVLIEGVAVVFEVGKSNNGKKWTRFVNKETDVLFIPAFDDIKIFQGWAEISPSPKSAADIESIGFKVFDSALSAMIVVVQQRIRAKGDGKQLIDNALAALTKQFISGNITIEEMQSQASKLLGQNVVQLS